MSESYIKKPGLRARAFLEGLVHERARTGNDRLPTIAAMAASCQVTKVTLARAVRVLSAAGLLRVVPRGGIFINSLPAGTVLLRRQAPRESGVSAGMPRWQEIADDVSNRIADGRLLPGAVLPRLKEVCVLHGASYQTVHRALALLVEGGKIVRHGRRYRVFQPPRRGSTGTVVMIASRAFIDNRGGDTSRAGEILRYLEPQLQRINVRCLLVAFEDFTRQRTSQHGSTFDNVTLQRSVLGYMVQMSTLPHVPLHGLCGQLRRTGKPVALLDETGYRLREIDAPTFRRLKVFTVATGEHAGLDMGSFLYGLGHRRAAFLSPARYSSWCINRLRGIAKTLGREDVLECAVGRYWFDYALRREQTGTPEEQTLRREARSKLLAAGSVFPRDYILPLPQTYPVFRQLLQRALRPAFERALSDKSVSIWVAASDVVALAALDFLSENGVRVPGDLSLASFDNSYEAFARDITSYDFRIEAVAGALLDYAVRGPVPATGQLGDPTEIPGTVMPRHSTQPVAGSPLREVYYPFERAAPPGFTQDKR